MPYMCLLDCDVLLLFAISVGFIVFVCYIDFSWSTNACLPLSVSGPTCICDTEVQGNPRAKKPLTFRSMALKIVLIPFR